MTKLKKQRRIQMKTWSKAQDALTFGLRSFDEEVSFSDN